MRTKPLRLLTMLAVSACSAGALKAQDAATSDDIAALKKGQEDLQKEITALRNDLKNVLREVQALKAGNKPTPPKRPVDTTIHDIDISDSAFIGPKDAPVTIVEFSDFQCPYCTREYPTLKQIRQLYPDDVKLVFKHFPLSFHKNSPPAHAAAELAYEQGGSDEFWKMHDLILSNPRNIGKDQLRSYAEQLGMDLAKFDEVMADQSKMAALYSDDQKEARKCGVRGTPTIFINGLKLAQRNLAGYKARINEILKDKKDTKAEGTH